MKRNLKLKLFVTSCFAAMLALSSCNVMQELAANISEDESPIAESNSGLEQEIADRDKEIEQLKEQLERLQEDAAKAESEAQASSEVVSKQEISSTPPQTSSAPPPSSSAASASSQVSSQVASSSSSQSSSVAQSSSQAGGITGSSDSGGITFSFGGSTASSSASYAKDSQNSLSHAEILRIAEECAIDVGLNWDLDMKEQGGFEPGVSLGGLSKSDWVEGFKEKFEYYKDIGIRRVYGEIAMSRHGYYVFVLYR